MLSSWLVEKGWSIAESGPEGESVWQTICAG